MNDLSAARRTVFWWTIVLALAVAAPAQARGVSTRAVTQAFRAHGLEASRVRALTRDDYGLAPYVGHGVRFLIPSLCVDCGGRVFTGSLSDLRALRSYYVGLGRGSAILFSWTALNARRRVLVQINGDLSSSKWRRYRFVVAHLKP